MLCNNSYIYSFFPKTNSMYKKGGFYILLLLIISSCSNKKSTSSNDEFDNIKVIPVSHGSLILEYKNTTIYIDPVGIKEDYKSYNSPNFILITDIHSDHFNNKTLIELKNVNTTLIVPEAVNKLLDSSLKKNVIVMNNNDISKISKNLTVEAVPMYNLREEALKFHPKGRGNGYVITINNERIYISGDTEDIPEMRQLKNIDRAFVCMNLPWTMPIKNAADAVLDFKPKHVYPYHYRGTDGLSDVNEFKKIINKKDKKIDVHLLKWY